MIIYHTGEAFKFKESKVIEVILKITVGVLCAFSLFYLNKTVYEVGQLIKYEKAGSGNFYDGYYKFRPHGHFWLKADKYSTGSFNDHADEKMYIELVNDWRERSDLKIVRYNTYRYARTDRYVVFTYYVPKSYPIEWDGIVLEMAEGEWFQDGEASLILLKGKDHQVGDKVEIKDSSGEKHWLPITGIAKDQYLVETNYFSGVEWDERLNGFVDLVDDIYLLNPFCNLNEPTDYGGSIVGGYGFLKTDNYLLMQEIETYGYLDPIKIVDSRGEEIKRPDMVYRQKDDLPFWVKIGNYISVFHLWYIIPFVICYVSQYVLIYYLHQWNFAKRLWIYLFIAVLLMGGFHWYAYLAFLPVFIFHLIVKKNTVHGRTYIVDGWDETDVNI